MCNYAAPVWSTNVCDTNYRNTEYTQNDDMMISTGCHKMVSVDHLHVETDVLKVWEHSQKLSAQHLARCLEPDNVNHSISIRDIIKRRMKETLFTIHRNTVEPLMITNDSKATFQAIHTDAVNQAANSQ